MKEFENLEKILFSKHTDPLDSLSNIEKDLISKGYKCEDVKFILLQPERLSPEDVYDKGSCENILC